MSNTENKTQLALEKVQRTFAEKAEMLEHECLYLAGKLEKVAKQCALAIEGLPYSINSLGEVQRTGDDIDRACADLKTLSDMIGLLRWAAKDEE